jgi:iron complex outermembrane receptor protein
MPQCPSARLLAGVLLLAATPTYGDDALEEIVVTATGLSTASSTTKTDTPIIETPQSISIITREEMDVRAVATVADALSYSAGVQAESSGIDSRVDEVSVRGFGAGGFSSNNNFIDGLRLPSGGQWTRSSFDPFGLQQVDVLKGPSGALYGQTAPGGVVNLVTKRPSFTPLGEVLLQTSGYTDLDHWQPQLGVDVGGPVGDNVAWRFTGLARDGETQIDKTSNSRYYLAPGLTWNIGDDTTWTLLGQWQRDRGGSTYQFLPATGTLYPSNGRRIALDAYLGEPDWNQYDRDQYLAASFFEHRINDTLTVRNNLRYTHIESLYRVTVLSGDTVTDCTTVSIAGCIDGQTIRRRAVQGIGETDGIAVDTQLEGRFATGAVEHTLLGGVDYFHTEWEHYRDLVNGSLVLPLLDFYNPVPRGSAGYAQALAPQTYTETRSEQLGIYLQDQLEIGSLRMTIGGRYDDASDEAFNPLAQDPSTATTITEADALTGRIGAVYLFDNGVAPYASYSESFQPATGTYWGGRPFDPTTGQQVEFGVRYQPPGSNAFVTLGAYEITQQNITTPDPDHMCGASACQTQTGEGRVRGVELEGRATLPFGMALIGTVTRTDAEVTKTNVAGQRGNTLAAVPESMASLFVDYRFQGALEGLGLGGGVRYTGESYGDVANNLVIPDYTVYDLFARYDFHSLGSGVEGLSLSANVRNLTNERYVATCTSTASCYYGSGRTLSLRVQYRW